jgi:TatD DNase family protein
LGVGVQNGAEQNARQDGGEPQSQGIGRIEPFDQPDGFAAACEPHQSGGTHGGVRLLGEDEILGFAHPNRRRADARGSVLRCHDEADGARRKQTRPGIALVSGPGGERARGIRQPDSRGEEPLSVGIPCVDVHPIARVLSEYPECTRHEPSLAAPNLPGYPWPASEMLALVDAHCHLDRHHFAEGPDAVMTRAAAAGVVGFVVVGLARPNGPPGSDPLDPVRFAVDLARGFPGQVAACVGLHPHDAQGYSEAIHAGLREIALLPEVAAIGEIGLDFHYDHSPRDAQRLAFARLIGLAREVRKPIVVHTRSAPGETLAILAAEGARDVGGIIHCFSEDRDFAAHALDSDFDLSLSGIVTFKGARAIQDVAAWAPIDRLLVETDSPFLAPVPLRGKRCEPAFVVHTARVVADLRAVSLEVFGRATLANTERRFGKSFARQPDRTAEVASETG